MLGAHGEDRTTTSATSSDHHDGVAAVRLRTAQDGAGPERPLPGVAFASDADRETVGAAAFHATQGLLRGRHFAS